MKIFMIIMFIMKFSNKSFTLIEVIIVVIMISVWIITMMWVISYWRSTMDRIRKDIIAINLARSWMEWVYNIRDTNWVKWSGKKDECWLKMDPLSDDDWECSNDQWIVKWNYILSWTRINNQTYYYLQPEIETLDMENSYIDNDDMKYIMCMENGFWYNCPWEEGFIEEWKFFRMIVWKWLYDKMDNEELSDCSNWNDIANNWDACWTELAKEFRFCSVVYFFGNWVWNVEFCWVVTNFNSQW